MTPAALLAAVLAVARAPAVDAVAERPRLEALASTISTAAHAHPWPGDVGEDQAALALVAVASHESGLRAEVADCRVTGDRHRGEGPREGASVGLWQLHRGRAWGGLTRAELCASVDVQADRAATLLASYAQRCTGSWVSAFQGYAAGGCGRVGQVQVTRAGRLTVIDPGAELCASWVAALGRAGWSGVACSGRAVGVRS